MTTNAQIVEPANQEDLALVDLLRQLIEGNLSWNENRRLEKDL